jgi:ABC-2 type transport system permease protein
MRALMGAPVPLLAAVALGGGIFWLANALLGPRFATDAAAAAGAGAATGRSSGRAPGVAASFAAGAFAVTLRKELKLLLRDPGLLAQVLLRVLYMLPLGFLLLRQAGSGDRVLATGSAGALVLLAGQVAGSLAWITVSAEDAPELLASAPAPISLVRRGKLAAVAAPLAVLLAPFLLPLLALNPLAGVAATVGCAASVTASALMNVWWQRPGKRSEFRTRRRASWFVTWAEFALGLLIAGATSLFALGLLWGLVPAALAGLLLLLLRRSDEQIAEALRAAG